MRQFPQYVVEGIVLKRKNIGEADRVITLFTKEHGKIYAIAKGVRKVKSRRAPFLEVFTHAKTSLYKGKKWDTLTEIQPLHTYTQIRSELSRVASAYYLMEIVDRLLPEKQEHADIFNLLTQSLDQLDKRSQVDSFIRNNFSVLLLEALGYISNKQLDDEVSIHRFIEATIERKLKSTKAFAYSQ